MELRCIFYAFLLCSLINTVSAQVPVALEMQIPPEAAAQGPGEVIINGKPASFANWPATLIFVTNTGFCTSTAVGGRVLLTAAHCVEDGSEGLIKSEKVSIKVSCRHHPDYATNYTADVAVCSTDADIPVKYYERVNTSSQRVIVDQSATLIGYGCRQPGGGGPSQALYEGTSTITKVPASQEINHYVETKGGAAVCFGDSGGAAFIFDGPLRFVFGVNSRGDIGTRSLITSTHRPEIITFIKSQAALVQSKICGVDAEAVKCRPG